MGAYDTERGARGPINPPPDPPDWGDFSILVGAANDWYSRRGATRGSLQSGQPMVGGMVVNRIRPSSLDILVNIESGSHYAEWAAATDHILYLTTADWEVIVPPSTLSRAFGMQLWPLPDCAVRPPDSRGRGWRGSPTGDFRPTVTLDTRYKHDIACSHERSHAKVSAEHPGRIMGPAARAGRTGKGHARRAAHQSNQRIP